MSNNARYATWMVFGLVLFSIICLTTGFFIELAIGNILPIIWVRCLSIFGLGFLWFYFWLGGTVLDKLVS